MDRAPVRALVCVALALVALPVAAEEDLGWSDTAEFSYVLTDGNSESQTLGFKNVLKRAWENARFTLKAGGIRAETTTTTRTAVGTPGAFVIDERSVTETAAENYYLNGRYRADITDRFFWYAGAGWDRNRPAGIENRYIAEGGVGNTWVANDDVTFSTEYGATFTDQEDVVGPGDSFVGARLSWDYENKLTDNTKYTNVLVLDANLDESDDWRGDMVNSVAVAMNSRLALKLSLQWLYDNQPSFAEVALENPIGTPTGQTVLFELDDLDTVFTASLVVNF